MLPTPGERSNSHHTAHHHRHHRAYLSAGTGFFSGRLSGRLFHFPYPFLWGVNAWERFFFFLFLNVEWSVKLCGVTATGALTQLLHGRNWQRTNSLEFMRNTGMYHLFCLCHLFPQVWQTARSQSALHHKLEDKRYWEPRRRDTGRIIGLTILNENSDILGSVTVY